MGNDNKNNKKKKSTTLYNFLINIYFERERGLTVDSWPPAVRKEIAVCPRRYSTFPSDPCASAFSFSRGSHAMHFEKSRSIASKWVATTTHKVRRKGPSGWRINGSCNTTTITTLQLNGGAIAEEPHWSAPKKLKAFRVGLFHHHFFFFFYSLLFPSLAAPHLLPNRKKNRQIDRTVWLMHHLWKGQTKWGRTSKESLKMKSSSKGGRKRTKWSRFAKGKEREGPGKTAHNIRSSRSGGLYGDRVLVYTIQPARL